MKGTTLRMDLDAIAYHYEQLAKGESTLGQTGHLCLVRRLRERATGLAPSIETVRNDDETNP